MVPVLNKGSFLAPNLSDSGSPLVSLRNVTKVFKTSKGTQTSLKDVSFDVFPGDVVSLIGPSGSGKSTCLRTINALETVTSGSISVCGSDYATSRLPEHVLRRNTAMIFQRFELFPHLTALENVALAPQLVLKKKKSDALDEAMQLLTKVGLETHSHKFPSALSGGQQQRVAIARALAMNPKVLLCDEPTSALDPELVGEVIEILAAIAKEGMTMIIVTHEMAFAEEVSKRTLFLDHGEILEEGPTSQLFHSPKSPRLQQFLSRIGR